MPKTTEKNFALREHPARVIDRLTNLPLEVDGKTMPMFPDQQALYFGGQLVAYVIPKDGALEVSYILDDDALHPTIKKKGKAFVSKKKNVSNRKTKVVTNGSLPVEKHIKK